MKAIFFNSHGSINELKYGEVPKPIPKKGEVLLKVISVALNRLDLWVLEGWPALKLKMPHIGGSDIVGKITSDTTNSKFKLGDIVSVYPGYNEKNLDKNLDQFVVSPSFKVIGEHSPGGLAEYVSVPEENLHLLEENDNPDKIVASILTGLTSYRMLFKKTTLNNAKSILIVGSGGGLNLTSTLIAKAYNLNIIVLSGSKEKEAKLEDLGINSVINYKEKDNWHKEVLKMTEGKGVDLVVDNVGEKTFMKSLKSLAFGGSLLTVGNTSGYNLALDNRLIFAKQLNILGSTMGSFTDFTESQKLIREKNIAIPIDSTFKLEDGIKAFKRLKDGDNFGKIIVKP